MKAGRFQISIRAARWLPEERREIEGFRFSVGEGEDAVDLFVHRDVTNARNWSISEPTTGYGIALPLTARTNRKKVIEAAREYFVGNRLEHLRQGIARGRATKGNRR
jgi:hypothetical protein